MIQSCRCKSNTFLVIKVYNCMFLLVNTRFNASWLVHIYIFVGVLVCALLGR
jgi:hypothetical protein